MIGLSGSERISMIRSAVLIQYTRVTDRQTDGQTDGIGVAYTRYSIYAVARKNRRTTFCRGGNGELKAKKWQDAIEKQKRISLTFVTDRQTESIVDNNRLLG